MKKKLIVANWKMNKNISETFDFAESLDENFAKTEDEVAVCPPFVSILALKPFAEKCGFSLGAQNCFWEESGAFTGEISASMLKDAGVKYVILGHSERREYFFETGEMINKKILAALKNGLKPIVCVGESLETKEKGLAEEFVKSQLEDCFENINIDEIKNISVAYEPIWAIGTGKVASPAEASKMCGFIRNFISEKFGSEAALEVKILYGGSVNEKNAKDFFAMENIDGGLIGGASLDAEKFKKIVNFRL